MRFQKWEHLFCPGALIEHDGQFHDACATPSPPSQALGGAMGGYTTGKKEIIEMLRQRSRPYLFSNSLAPAIVGASIKVFDMLKEILSKISMNSWRANTYRLND